MRPTLTFLLYLFAAYCLAALLCATVGSPLAEALGVPPHKIIGRGGMLLALAGFWWLLRGLDLADRRTLGYGLPRRVFLRDAARGLGVGVLILACLSLALLALEIRVIPDRPDLALATVAAALGKGLLTGIAVALIEETFFRGALQSAIRRQGGAAAAVLLPSLLYAALHFFKAQPLDPGAAPGLTACLGSLASAFPTLFAAENLDSFLALTLVGVFLGLVRERTGHIAWTIGLHAGWVMVIKFTHKFTDLDPNAPLAPLVGTYDGMIGWLAAGWIGLLALGLAIATGLQRTGPNDHGDTRHPKMMKDEARIAVIVPSPHPSPRGRGGDRASRLSR